LEREVGSQVTSMEAARRVSILPDEPSRGFSRARE
jgi:hypothetical protein